MLGLLSFSLLFLFFLKMEKQNLYNMSFLWWSNKVLFLVLLMLSVSRSMSCEGSGCRWQESFARMAADIAGCMKVHVKGLTDRLMTEEQEKLRQNGTIDIVEVAGELRGGRHDYPGTISKV